MLNVGPNLTHVGKKEKLHGEMTWSDRKVFVIVASQRSPVRLHPTQRTQRTQKVRNKGNGRRWRKRRNGQNTRPEAAPILVLRTSRALCSVETGLKCAPFVLLIIMTVMETGPCPRRLYSQLQRRVRPYGLFPARAPRIVLPGLASGGGLKTSARTWFRSSKSLVKNHSKTWPMTVVGL